MGQGSVFGWAFVFTIFTLIFASAPGLCDGGSSPTQIKGLVSGTDGITVYGLSLTFGDHIPGTHLYKLERAEAPFVGRKYTIMNDKPIYLDSVSRQILTGPAQDRLSEVGMMESGVIQGTSIPIHRFDFSNKLFINEERGTFFITDRREGMDVAIPSARFSETGLLWNSSGAKSKKQGLLGQIYLKFEKIDESEMALETVYINGQRGPRKQLQFRPGLSVYLDPTSGNITAVDEQTGRSENIGYSIAIKINNGEFKRPYDLKSGFIITKALVLDRASGTLFAQSQPCNDILSRTNPRDIVELDQFPNRLNR